VDDFARVDERLAGAAVPELPEVEVVRLGLIPAVTNARVTAVSVFDERSLRRHDGPSEDFVERLTGSSFRGAERRGKFLWLPLDGALPIPSPLDASAPRTPTALVVHLGMSGQLLVRDAETNDKLTRIRIEFEHPKHGRLRLNFVDQRIFGSMAIVPLVPSRDRPEQLLPSYVEHIARDPLDEHFDEALFFARLSARKTGIKRALLDQSLVSGIGNIYADESLWAARIHYEELASNLTMVRKKRLLTEVRAVLERALGEGGTSFDAQYVNVNGQSGYFSHSLNAYGQQGRACPRCGRPIVRERFMNRGSHFCPFCQQKR
jgi:formamidopyrimidine-DNA glycosylase